MSSLVDAVGAARGPVVDSSAQTNTTKQPVITRKGNFTDSPTQFPSYHTEKAIFLRPAFAYRDGLFQYDSLCPSPRSLRGRVYAKRRVEAPVPESSQCSVPCCHAKDYQTTKTIEELQAKLREFEIKVLVAEIEAKLRAEMEAKKAEMEAKKAEIEAKSESAIRVKDEQIQKEKNETIQLLMQESRILREEAKATIDFLKERLIEAEKKS